MGGSVNMRAAVLFWAMMMIALSASPSHLAAAEAQGIEGSWTAEQSSEDNPGSQEVTLSFDRRGVALTGTMREASNELPLFDVRETGATISFTVVIPGTPYVSIHYSGARSG